MKRKDRLAIAWAIAAMATMMPGLVFAQNANAPAAAKASEPGNLPAAGNNADNGAPNADYTNFNLYNQTPWFADPGIRKQLNLNDKQFDQLNGAYQKSWTTYNQGLTGLDNGLTPEQRQKREGELYNDFRKSFSPALQSTFADEAARQRYDQLYNQYRGLRAFNDPSLQQDLNLTDAQRMQFQNLDRDWNRKLRKWSPDYPTERDMVDREFAESRKATQARVNTILTPEQQKRWEKLHGQPYEFTPNVYFSNGTTTNTTLKPELK